MKTQQECLVAIVGAYTALVHNRAVTMEEVSEWANARGLEPTPKRGDAPELFAAFEARLVEAKRLGLLPDEQSPRRKDGEAAYRSLVG